MKNSVSVLRTTTAIVLSFSLVGANAAAAGTGAPAFQLAQAAAAEANAADESAVAKEAKAAEEAAAAEAKAAEEAAAAEAKAAEEAAAAEAKAAEEAAAAAGAEAAEQAAAAEAKAAEEAAAVEAKAAEEAAAIAEAKAAEEAAAADEAKAAEEAAAAEAQAAEEAAAAEAKAAEEAAAAEAEAAEEAAAAEAKAAEEAAAAEAKAAEEAAAAEAKAAEEAAAAEAEAAEQESAQDPAETVEDVTEAEIEEVTSTGQDVVIEEETSAADLQAQLEELRQRQVDLETQLQQTVEVQEEVITDETSRSADEEVLVRDDDDDNQIWKYLGAAAAGAAVGALVPALGGRLVQDQGDRVIVERGGEFFVRSDENQLLRQPGTTVQTEEFPSGISRTTVTREDGSRIVTIRNDGGFILRRTRITPDGQEIVLLQQTPEEVYSFGEWEDTLPEVTAHSVQTVDYSRADSAELHDALYAQPSYQFERSFPLQAVRESERVRELVPAVDLPINFASGSAAIQRDEVEELTQLGRMMADAIDENPREIFLVEGHTDAVGSNLMNLALSDRRAEAVALALTQYFDVPPENLVVQGYGERYLKEETEASSAVNRRATVRRITPLIDQVASR